MTTLGDSLQEFADNCGPDAEGVVYLLHFNTPLAHAWHYMGWTANLEERLHAHETGSGSRLMEVIGNAGITWRLARTWAGPRSLERQLKRQHHGPRLCPICNGDGHDHT